MKNRRARARWTGSFGSRPELGYRSATNSSRTSDSAILADSGDGFSGCDLELPYTRAGTCHTHERLRVKRLVAEGISARGVENDLACWVNSRGIPLGLVLKVDPIPGHVGFCFSERDVHLWYCESAHRPAGKSQLDQPAGHMGRAENSQS